MWRQAVHTVQNVDEGDVSDATRETIATTGVWVAGAGGVGRV
jgi:hypothetical protein